MLLQFEKQKLNLQLIKTVRISKIYLLAMC